MFYVVLLIVIEVILFAANYIFGTHLIGWDNIMPEFNLMLNFKRALFSVWQEYRGLGLLDGMSHAATLTHTIYIAILSIFLPQSIVRYVFIFLTHLAGGIGMYFLLKSLLRFQKISNFKFQISNFSAFVGALFYMFNIGVIQMYYAPLEVFAVHFAAIPILVLFTIKALSNPSRKNLLILFISGFLTSTQAFVPTVFLVFFILFLSLLFFYFFYTKNIKRVVVVGLIVVAANAFWMLPYVYSGAKNAPVIPKTRINEFSSEEIYYRNSAKGDLANVLTLNGFMMDSIEQDLVNIRNIYIMGTWRDYQTGIIYKLAIGLIMLTGLVGLIGIIVKKQKKYYPFVFSFGIAFFFLANNTPGIEQLNNILRQVFPLVGEVFRFPFTKFITLFTFCISIFIAFGIKYIFFFLGNYHKKINFKLDYQDLTNLKFKVQSSKLHFKVQSFYLILNFKLQLLIFNFKLLTIDILSLVYRILHKEIAKSATFVILILAIVYLSFPAFRGNFIYPSLKIKLPEDYSQTFDFFNSVDENQRVAVFPLQTFWNWQYRSFGQRGSGFLWQGIKQPITERAFDPWSNYNEQFYNEISYAVSTDNYGLFKTVLNKYDITYILLDQYIRESLTTQPINYDKLTNFLERDSNFLYKKRAFGKIIIYEVKKPNSWVSFIDQNKTLNIYPSFNNENTDTFSAQGKNYISESNNPDIIPFFPSLFTGKLQSDLEFNIKEDKSKITLESNKKLGIKTKNYQLQLPSIFNSDFLIPVRVKSSNGMLVVTPLYPKIFVNGQEISVGEQNTNFLIDTNIKNPSSVSFADTDIQINNLQTGGTTYLLKKYLNTIRVKDNAGNEEVSVIDTNTLPLNPISLNLSTTEIDSLKVEIEKVQSPFSQTDIIEKEDYKIKQEVDTFNTIASSNSYVLVEKVGQELVYDIKGTVQELAFYNQNLFHKSSYIIFAKTKYDSGLPINFYVDNPYEGRAEIETRLSKENTTNTIILPKTEEFYQGYGFHFTMKSVGTEYAAGTIENIELYPFPYELLKDLKIVSFNSMANKENSPEKVEANFTRKGNFIYEVEPVKGDNYVVLSQAFDAGWKAYSVQSSKFKVQNWLGTYLPFIFGKELKDHVLVNNWENGWKIESSKLIIVYWPQYLEFLGFLLLPVTVLVILKFKG